MKDVFVMDVSMDILSALIVDDSELSLIICEEILSGFNISSVLAESGEQALLALAEHEFDIVFLDHLMPGMDGVELCRRIRALKGDNLHVVALTGNDVEEYVEEYTSAGMNGWLTKPIDPDAMEDILFKLSSKKPKHVEFNAALPEEAKRRLLKAFVAQVDEKLPLMDDYIAQGRLKDYMIEAHSLKSSLINAGEKSLSEEARELETAAKNGDFDTVKEKNPAFSRAVREFSATVSEKLAEGGDTSKRPPGDSRVLKEKLIMARTAMDDFETKTAEKIICELTKEDHEPYNDEIAKLYDLFNAYAFDRICKTLFSLITVLGD